MRKSGFRWIAGATLVAAAALIAAGCGSDDSDSKDGGGKAADQTLRFAIASDVSTFDPPMTEDLYAANVVNTLFSGLTRYDAESNTYVNDLAEDIEVGEDGLEITATLRDGLTWSNGDPLTAADFEYGIERALSAKQGAPNWYLLSNVTGAAAYHEGKGKVEDVGISAEDDTTLKITLDAPIPWINEVLAAGIAMPVHKATVEKFADKWTAPENIVTNGAFTLESVASNDKTVVVKNDDYWNADEVDLETIEFTVIGDPSTGYADFEAEKIDTGFGEVMVPTEEREAAAQDDRFMDFESLSTDIMYFNTLTDAMKEAKVREAIAVAMDRRSIIDNVTKDGSDTPTTITPIGMPGYDTISEGSTVLDENGEPDMERAAELLEEAGFKEGTKINVVFTSAGGAGSQVAPVMKSTLEELGFAVTLRDIPDGNAFFEALNPPVAKDIDIVFAGWAPSFSDSSEFLGLFTCDSEFNTSGYCDEEYDKVAAEIPKTVDDDARFTVAGEAEAMLTGEDGAFPAISWRQPRNYTMAQSNVEGVALSPGGMWDFASIYLSE